MCVKHRLLMLLIMTAYEYAYPFMRSNFLDFIQWKFFNALFNRCPADGGVGHCVEWRNQLQFTAVLLLYSRCDSCSHIKQCVHRSVFESIVLKLHLFTKLTARVIVADFCFALFYFAHFSYI